MARSEAKHHHRGRATGNCLAVLMVAVGMTLGTTGQSARADAAAAPAPVAEKPASQVINVPGDEPTIQAAIIRAAAGARIVVAPGKYEANLDFKHKDIVLLSSDGAEKTILDGKNKRVIDIGPRGQVIGFTILGGHIQQGGGIFVRGNDTVICGNIFTKTTHKTGGGGAAIFGEDASPLIERNIFRANGSRPRLPLDGVVTFTKDSSPLIRNNLFVDNPSVALNLSASTGKGVVVNNTFVRNTTALSGAWIARNNIIVKSTVGVTGTVQLFEGNLLWQNQKDSDASARVVQVRTLAADPQFVDAASDFHLTARSPANGAGIIATDNADSGERDLDGKPRWQAVTGGDGTKVDRGRVDLGAYQFATDAVATIANPPPATVATISPPVVFTPPIAPPTPPVAPAAPPARISAPVPPLPATTAVNPVGPELNPSPLLPVTATPSRIQAVGPSAVGLAAMALTAIGLWLTWQRWGIKPAAAAPLRPFAARQTAAPLRIQGAGSTDAHAPAIDPWREAEVSRVQKALFNPAVVTVLILWGLWVAYQFFDLNPFFKGRSVDPTEIPGEHWLVVLLVILGSIAQQIIIWILFRWQAGIYRKGVLVGGGIVKKIMQHKDLVRIQYSYTIGGVEYRKTQPVPASFVGDCQGSEPITVLVHPDHPRRAVVMDPSLLAGRPR